MYNNNDWLHQVQARIVPNSLQPASPMTYSANNGSFVFARFVGWKMDHIEHAFYSLLYEAVFELKEAGFKLNVTRVGPKLTQSANVKDSFSWVETQLSSRLVKLMLSCLLQRVPELGAISLCSLILWGFVQGVPAYQFTWARNPYYMYLHLIMQPGLSLWFMSSLTQWQYVIYNAACSVPLIHIIIIVMFLSRLSFTFLSITWQNHFQGPN